MTLGLGFYTTDRDIQSAVDQDSIALPALDATATQRIDLQLDTTKYQAGAAVGFALTDALRLCVGVFGVYATQDAYVQFVVDVDDASGRAAFESVTARLATGAWGLVPTAGMQWDVTRAVHLALTARAPELMLTASADSAGTAAVGSTFTDPPVVSLGFYDEADETSKLQMLAPARFALGAAFDPSPMVRVALEGEVSLPMENTALGVEHEVVDNGRRGVRLYDLNTGFVADGLPILHFGIGIHTGEAIAGNIGAPQRLDYTLIGVAVNTTARIESACKEVGHDLLVSEATRTLLGERARVGDARSVQLKGKALPTRVYPLHALD